MSHRRLISVAVAAALAVGALIGLGTPVAGAEEGEPALKQFSKAVVPSISGSAVVGKKLTAKPGSWSPKPSSFEYQWFAGGVEIPGASGSSYVLGSAEFGTSITVRVTAKLAGYAPKVMASKATKKIAAGSLSAKSVSVKNQTTGKNPATTAPRFNDTLAAVTAAWGPGEVELSYQWLRSGKAIGGAKEDSYTLAASDLGKQISVKVTGKAHGYMSKSQTSAKTKKVSALKLAATPSPKIVGTPGVGEKLGVDTGDWGPAPVNLSYQWLRDGKTITGAGKAAYTTSSSDRGKYLSVRVTGKKSGYTSVSKTSAKVKVGVLSAKTPTMQNQTLGKDPAKTAPRFNDTLVANGGVWGPGEVNLKFQWYRSGKKITGATAQAYTLLAADVGKAITVKATGSAKGFTQVTKTSKASKNAVALKFAKTPVPLITGKPVVGEKLGVDPGTWSPAPDQLSYQWYRSGTKITNATKPTYSVIAADKDKTITVKVTGKKSGYTSATTTSKATSKVSVPTPPAPPPAANNEQAIWNFLVGKGLNAYATAGIMGNLFAESGLKPTNLQNSFEKSLGFTDASYTAAVDNGSYTNFAKDTAGYGLAQWAYSTRKQALLNFAKANGKSVGDLNTQLGYLWKELESSEYKSLMSKLKSATSVKQASDAVLTGFEKPKDQSDDVKKTRAGYGQGYYNKYAAKT
ncbi:MAG: phage tail-type lysozyme domain-containing protein [Propionibacteriaceae bacterium]|jgi:hypothetical protein|nr:phage tail-type lysozyme domain-containing protein [Propionibacteriaceae bacterium]